MKRTIRVPAKRVSRFNKLARIEKHWDGSFNSPHGSGYCASPNIFSFMEYHFTKPMKLKIEIKMDGAAFESQQGDEVGRILKKLAADIKDMSFGPAYRKGLYDSNGNRVGEAKVTR